MDAGELAAFHGAPGDGVGPLREALASDSGDESRLTWLLGVCLGASGAYGEAFEVLAGHQETPYGSLIASTLGSLHRQLARYDVARGHDQRALDLATTTDSWVDACLGLAADAVGVNEPGVAEGHLAAMRGDFPEAPTWRVRTRAEWVAAEVALLTGDVELARKASGRAADLATKAEAPRHLAKSLLFVAVSGPDREALDRAWSTAVDLGCRPLIWPAGKLLLEAPGADLGEDRRAEVAKLTHEAVRAIRDGLPSSIGLPWAESTGITLPPDAL